MSTKNKKRYLHLLIACLLIAVAVFTAGCGGSSTDKKTTGEATNEAANANKQKTEVKSEQIVLKLSHPTPGPSFFGQGYDAFAKAVEEESKGQIKVEVHPAATLVADTEILDAIRLGNVDIGHFMSANLSPTIRELTPFEVPIAHPGDKFSEFVKATQPILEKIFEKYNVKYLGANAADVITFSSDKQIKLPQDLKGKTVRTPGKWGGEAIKSWGGSPVAVPIGELAVALDRGVVDVSFTGWMSAAAFKFYESAPKVSLSNSQQMFTGLIMSEKAWNKLNEDQRQAVQRAAQRWMDFSYNLAGKEKQKFEQAVQKAGGTIYYLTEAENSEFLKVTEPLMKKVKEISGPEGEELIKALEK